MLYRDLTERFSVKQPALLKYLLKFFLQNLANPISITKVFNDLKSQGYSIGKNTVFDYVSHLEEALFHQQYGYPLGNNLIFSSYNCSYLGG